MFDTYVFDLDGTLLDTLDDLTSSVNAALEAFGCPVRSREEVRGFVGNGIRLLVRRAAPCGADFAGIFEAFKAHYAAHCFDKTKPYAGVTELLTQLKARGAKTAIVSNKADFAVRELSARFFGKLIDAAAGEREDAGIRKKPAPDSVLSVLKLLEEDGKRAVYIGAHGVHRRQRGGYPDSRSRRRGLHLRHLGLQIARFSRRTRRLLFRR